MGPPGREGSPGKDVSVGVLWGLAGPAEGLERKWEVCIAWGSRETTGGGVGACRGARGRFSAVVSGVSVASPLGPPWSPEGALGSGCPAPQSAARGIR